MKIKDINVKMILDSRGKETLEAVMFAERSGQGKTQNGAEGDGDISAGASVPSGKSTGSHEVFVLEPEKALIKFAGIKAEILSKDFKDQREFDDFLIALDGSPDLSEGDKGRDPSEYLRMTKSSHSEKSEESHNSNMRSFVGLRMTERFAQDDNEQKPLINSGDKEGPKQGKSNLGGNLILALSLSFARLMAKTNNQELWEYIKENSKFQIPNSKFPFPIFNVINGGEHAHNKLTFQEFQVIPYVKDFGMALSIGQEFYKKLGRLLEDKFGKDNITLGDEAGYSAPFESDEQAIEIIYDLIRLKNYPLRIGLDCAATSFWQSEESGGMEDAGSRGKKSPKPPFGKGAESGYYLIGDKKYSPEELTQHYLDLIERYNIVSIEDPFYEEAFGNFAELTRELAHKGTRENPLYPPLERGQDAEEKNILVITDDLTTTNSRRLQKAIGEKSGNAILIKLNQIGSLTETLDVIKIAYENNWKAVVSHRSGETMDDFIADLAYAVSAWGIKAGAPAKPERMAKYNRLLKIFLSQTP